jgi:hypothetical protein
MVVILKLQHMKVCGKLVREKDLEHYHGVMAASFKGLGRTICDLKAR